MSKKEFFPPRPTTNPTIYAYELVGVSTHKGLIKIGFTSRDAFSRVSEQLRTSGLKYTIVFEESAMRNDGSSFTDHDIHRLLRKQGFANPDGEWFKCTLKDLQKAIREVKTGERTEANRTLTFGMRPEQHAAVHKTIEYFNSFKLENTDRTPNFLWNAKMRFGKTFASYQLAKKMQWTKILVLTFKPAVQNAWDEDLMTHVDFEGWQFIARNGLTFEQADPKKPIVCFGSFQDYLGKNTSTGGIKTKNEWVHATHWDCVIFDEYHYGAWRESAKELFEAEGKREMEFGEGEGLEYFDEGTMPITTSHYLYLSGTPFRAIASGEFIEDQIFNWTYSDEQKAKDEWKETNGPNPYASLPRMVMMTYQMPDAISQIAMQGEFDGFDLNIFFRGVFGNKIFNQSKWFTDFFGSFEGSAKGIRALDSWTPALGNDAKAPIWESASNISTNGAANSWYVEDGSFLRIQRLAMYYDFDSSLLKRLKLSRLSVGVSANNIWTLTKYTGLDPMVGGGADTNFGIDVGNYPVTPAYMLNFSIGF
ncbi:MAG: hypothetical protein RJA90_897 [Bacteroidota bacterium]